MPPIRDVSTERCIVNNSSPTGLEKNEVISRFSHSQKGFHPATLEPSCRCHPFLANPPHFRFRKSSAKKLQFACRLAASKSASLTGESREGVGRTLRHDGTWNSVFRPPFAVVPKNKQKGMNL
jgi:hypothetical protein